MQAQQQQQPIYVRGSWGFEPHKIIPLGKYATGWPPHGMPGLSLDCYLNRRQLRDRALWRGVLHQWKQAGMVRLKHQIQPLVASLGLTWGNLGEKIEAIYCIVGETVFASLKENPQRFNDNFNHQRLDALFALAPKIRWRLLHAMLDMHWRKALKLVFPKVGREAINGCEDLQGFLKCYPTVVHWKEPGSLDAHVSWARNRQSLSQIGLTKPVWLNYCRRWDTGAEAWDQPSRHLISLSMEVGRAKEEGADLADLQINCQHPPEPPEANRLHDLVGVRIQAHYRAQRGPGVAAVQHRKNWACFTVPAGWTPLISEAEFEDEGARMHHCVGTYAHRTNSLYAHIELDGKQATLEASLSDFTIRQLYSFTNQPVDEGFRQAVQVILHQMKTQTKIPT